MKLWPWYMLQTKLENKAVIEWDPSWWKVTDKIENIGIVFCSVDAPKLLRATIVSNKTVYLRIHGYKEWYQYIYSKSELDEVYTSIRKLNADKKAIYLNNDHGMLENGLYLLKKLKPIETSYSSQLNRNWLSIQSFDLPDFYFFDLANIMQCIIIVPDVISCSSSLQLSVCHIHPLHIFLSSCIYRNSII